MRYWGGFFVGKISSEEVEIENLKFEGFWFDLIIINGD